MNSEKLAGILGIIVAVAVLAVAIAYGPLGQSGKAQQKVEQRAPPPAPVAKGPVVREVPQ
jgi:hypothetical protein